MNFYQARLESSSFDFFTCKFQIYANQANLEQDLKFHQIQNVIHVWFEIKWALSNPSMIRQSNSLVRLPALFASIKLILSPSPLNLYIFALQIEILVPSLFEIKNKKGVKRINTIGAQKNCKEIKLPVTIYDDPHFNRR